MGTDAAEVRRHETMLSIVAIALYYLAVLALIGVVYLGFRSLLGDGPGGFDPSRWGSSDWSETHEDPSSADTPRGNFKIDPADYIECFNAATPASSRVNCSSILATMRCCSGRGARGNEICFSLA